MKRILSASLFLLGLLSCGKSSNSNSGPVRYGRIVEAGGTDQLTWMSLDEVAASAGGMNPWLLSDQVAAQFSYLESTMKTAAGQVFTPAQSQSIRAQAQGLEASMNTFVALLNAAQVNAWFRIMPPSNFQFIDIKLSQESIDFIEQVILPTCDLADQTNSGNITLAQAQVQGQTIESKSTQIQSDVSARLKVLIAYLN